MIRRTHNGNWAVPGGAMDLGESTTDTGVRETREETGIDCEITGLVGIYTNPRCVIHYTSDEEIRQEFSIIFTARPTGGELRASSESTEPQWIPPAVAASMPMHPAMRQRTRHHLDNRREQSQRRPRPKCVPRIHGQVQSLCRARCLIRCDGGLTAARRIGGRCRSSASSGRQGGAPPGSCSVTAVCSTGWTAAVSGMRAAACSRRYSVACTSDSRSSRL